VILILTHVKELIDSFLIPTVQVYVVRD